MLVLALGGCFQAPGEPTFTQGPGRSSGTSRASSTRSATSRTSSSSVGTSTSATSSSLDGGGSGGSSSSSGGSSTAVGDGGVDCPDVYLKTRFFDALLYTPVVGASVQALDANGVVVPGSTVLTDMFGIAVVCLPHGVQLTLTVTGTGYTPTYLANMVLTQPWTFGLAGTIDGGDGTGIGLLSTSALSAISAFLSTPLDLMKPGLVLTAIPALPESVCKHQTAGWQYSVTAVDGGAFPDGGYVEIYLGPDDLPRHRCHRDCGGRRGPDLRHRPFDHLDARDGCQHQRRRRRMPVHRQHPRLHGRGGDSRGRALVRADHHALS